MRIFVSLQNKYLCLNEEKLLILRSMGSKRNIKRDTPSKYAIFTKIFFLYHILWGVLL